MSDDEPIDSETAEARSAELDGLRIRQLAAMRRAAYRSRSHAVIATLVCAVAAIQSAILLFQRLRYTGVDYRILPAAAILLLGAYGSYFFYRRAVELHHEARQSYQQEP